MVNGLPPVFASVTAPVAICDWPRRVGEVKVNGLGVNWPAAPPVAVPVTVNVTFVEPSVFTISVSMSMEPVGVLAVGAKVIVTVQLCCGWNTGRKLTGRQVPAALKSGDSDVSVLGK